MKISSLTMFLLLASFCQAEAATFRLALILGNNEGRSDRPPLRYSEQDARNLRDVLVQIGAFPEPHVRLLLGKNRETVLTAVRSLQAQALHLVKNPQDQLLLLVYFSGHSEGGFLELDGTPMAFQELRDEIRKIPGSTRLLILDTCKGGQLIRTKGGTPVPPFSVGFEGQELPQGEILITSSRELEDSSESSELHGSFFTHYLVSALRGTADFNLDGKVSLTEAYSFASESTSQVASRFRKEQHPTFEFNLSGAGEIYLTDVGGRAPILSLPPSESGDFLIYDKKTRTLVTEVEKKAGPPRFVALPVGTLLIRKQKVGYQIEQELTVQPGGLYHFQEEAGQRIRIQSGRRILSFLPLSSLPPSKTARSVLLREGEMVKLRLIETVSTKTSHAGDKIRFEAAEDLLIDDRLVIASGAPASGEILAVKERRGLVSGELVCRIGYVQAVDGQWIPLSSMVSRTPSGLRRVGEDGNTTPTGSGLETDIASGITAFFFLPLYPLFMGREAIIEEGTFFEAYVARDTKVR